MPSSKTKTNEATDEIVGTARSLREVADAFGVRADTISRNWIPNGMPQRTRDGHYDLARIAAWKRQRLRDHQSPSHVKRKGPRTSASNSDTDAVTRKRLAEARCKEAEAEKRELENKIRAGSVVQRDDVVLLFSEMILIARSRLMQLPERLMMRFPKDLRIGLTNEVRQQVELVLTEMADYRPDALVSQVDDDEDHEEDEDHDGVERGVDQPGAPAGGDDSGLSLRYPEDADLRPDRFDPGEDD